MNGPTHKAIGLATGCLVAAYGVSVGSELAPLSLVLAPVGATLADFDHHKTKGGRAVRKVIDIGTVAVIVGCAVILIAGYTGVLGDSMLYNAVLTGIAIAVPCICILPRIKFVRDRIKFITKHRGIMHTLLVPTLILIAMFINKDDEFLFWILAGLVAGYVSHLLSDSITKSRCPLLWPLTEEPVGIPIVETGTAMEYISATIIIGGELWLALMSLC